MSGESVEGEGISDEWAKPPSNVGENTMMEAVERGISDEELEVLRRGDLPAKGTVPAGSIRGVPHYWCSQTCHDEECEFGPCSAGIPTYSRKRIDSLIARVDAETLARAALEEELATLRRRLDDALAANASFAGMEEELATLRQAASKVLDEFNRHGGKRIELNYAMTELDAALSDPSGKP